MREELAEQKRAAKADAKREKAAEKARKKRNAARRRARKASKRKGRGLRAPPTRTCFSMPVPWGVDPWGNKVGDLI